MPRKLHSSWRQPIRQRDSKLILEIAKRAIDELPYNKLTLTMDLEAVHERTPLDLERLRDAPLSDFLHDIVGIHRHIDRATGELKDCFSPRFTKRKFPTRSIDGVPMFTCTRCGLTSYNQNDLREGYCANCHSFVRDNPDDAA